MTHNLNYSAKARFKMSGKRVAKAILLTMLAICMTFGLSSCGGTAKDSTKGAAENQVTAKDSTKGTAENQVKDDVSKFLSQDAAFSGQNLKVNSFSISKRQTNPEDKTDFVWCEVIATGGKPEEELTQFSCSVECEVTYGLYNDGWRLDTCSGNIVASSIKPLFYPTKEKAEEAVLENHGRGNGHDHRVKVHDMIEESDTEVVYPFDHYYYFTREETHVEGRVIYNFRLYAGKYRWIAEIKYSR